MRREGIQRGSGAGGLALAIALAAAPAALGQVTAPASAGPVGPSPTVATADNGIRMGDGRVHPYFDLDGDYDSAAGFFGTGGAGNLEPELVFHFRPGFRLELPSNWINLNLGADADWVQYSGLLSPGSPAYSHLEALANLEADFNKAGAVEFDIGDNFSRLDRTPNVVIGLGVLSLYNELHAAVPIHPGGGALEVTPGGSFSFEQYTPLSLAPVPGCTDPSCSPSLIQNLNYTNLRAGLDARWRFLPKTAIVLESAVDDRSYQGDTQHDALLLHVEGGLVGLITAKLALTLKAGWSEDFVEWGKTVVGHAELNYLMSDTSNVRVGYMRDLQAVPLFGTYTDDRGYAEARFLLGGRLTLRAYGAYDLLNYTGASRTDQMITADLGPMYQFTRWLIGSLGYTLNYRQTAATAAASVNYSRNVGYLRLTLTY